MRLTYIALVSICLCIAALSPDARANLGEALWKAKARARTYLEEYGAVEPMYHTGNGGQVVMECWAAPPNGWTKAQAYKFGTELLPRALRHAHPRALPVDGTFETFRYEDGTQLILEGLNGMYINVEVRTAAYKGPQC